MITGSTVPFAVPTTARTGKARLHGARAPAKADPLVRRLPVPRLRDRDQIRIAVVVEVDHAAERVGDVGDAGRARCS